MSGHGGGQGAHGPPVFTCSCGAMIVVGNQCQADRCKIVRLTNHVQRLESERYGMQQQIFAQQNGIAAREKSVACREAAVTGRETAASTARDGLVQREAAVDAKEKELAKLATKPAAKLAAKPAAKAAAHVAKLQQDLSAERRARATAQKKEAVANQQVAAQRTEIADLTKALRQETTKLEAAIEEAAAAKAASEKSLREKADALTAAHVEIASLQDAASDVKLLRTKIHKLEAKVKAGNDQKTALAQEKDRSRSYKTGLAEAKGKCIALEQQVQEKQKQLASANGTIAQLKQQGGGGGGGGKGRNRGKDKGRGKGKGRQKSSVPAPTKDDGDGDGELVPLSVQLAEAHAYIAKLKAASNDEKVEEYVVELTNTYYSKQRVAAVEIELQGLVRTARALRKEVIKVTSAKNKVTQQLIRMQKVVAAMSERLVSSGTDDWEPGDVVKLQSEVTAVLGDVKVAKLDADMNVTLVDGTDEFARKMMDQGPLQHWQDLAESCQNAAHSARDTFVHIVSHIESYIGGYRSQPSYPGVSEYAGAVAGFLKSHCEDLVGLTDLFIKTCSSLDPVLGSVMKYYKSKLGGGTITNTMYMLACSMRFFQLSCKAMKVNKDGTLSEAESSDVNRTYVLNVGEDVETKAFAETRKAQETARQLLEANQKLDARVKDLEKRLADGGGGGGGGGEGGAGANAPRIVYVPSDQKMEPFFLARVNAVVAKAFHMSGMDCSAFTDMEDLLTGATDYSVWAFKKLQLSVTALANEILVCRTGKDLAEKEMATEVKRARNAAIVATKNTQHAKLELQQLRNQQAAAPAVTVASPSGGGKKRRKRGKKGRGKGSGNGGSVPVLDGSSEARVVDMFREKITELRRVVDEGSTANTELRRVVDEGSTANTVLRRAADERDAENAALKKKISELEAEAGNVAELQAAAGSVQDLAMRNVKEHSLEQAAAELRQAQALYRREETLCQHEAAQNAKLEEAAQAVGLTPVDRAIFEEYVQKAESMRTMFEDELKVRDALSEANKKLETERDQLLEDERKRRELSNGQQREKLILALRHAQRDLNVVKAGVLARRRRRSVTTTPPADSAAAAAAAAQDKKRSRGSEGGGGGGGGGAGEDWNSEPAGSAVKAAHRKVKRERHVHAVEMDDVKTELFGERKPEDREFDVLMKTAELFGETSAGIPDQFNFEGL